MANLTQEKTEEILFYLNLGAKAEKIQGALEAGVCNANLMELSQGIISNCIASYDNKDSKYVKLMQARGKEYAKRADSILAKIKKMDRISEEQIREEIEFFRRIKTNCFGYIESLN